MYCVRVFNNSHNYYPACIVLVLNFTCKHIFALSLELALCLPVCLAACVPLDLYLLRRVSIDL